VSGYDGNSNAGMYTYNLTQTHYMKRIYKNIDSASVCGERGKIDTPSTYIKVAGLS